MEYQSGLFIDRNNLDEEAIQLPGWFGSVIESEANAAEKLAAFTDKMKVLQADIGLTLRGWTIPQINLFFGLALTKLTEGVYKDLVLLHPEVIALYNEINEARRDVTVYRAAVRSIEKKGDMLKELAKMYAQGYFMRIEGKAYKKPKMDLMLKKLEEQIIARAKKEAAAKPPPAPAQDTLQARINSTAVDNSGSSAGTSTPKTPKTPKTTIKPPQRIRG